MFGVVYCYLVLLLLLDACDLLIKVYCNFVDFVYVVTGVLVDGFDVCLIELKCWCCVYGFTCFGFGCSLTVCVYNLCLILSFFD